jgi:SAM-dependent methyltransferase
MYGDPGNRAVARRFSPTLSQAPQTRITAMQSLSEVDPSVAYWRGFYTDEWNGGERTRTFGRALMEVGATGHWLDAGCGIGMLTRHFRAAGLRVTGVDISPARVGEAAALTGLPLLTAGEGTTLDEHLREASVDQLPYDAGGFDGAYSSSVLEYVPDLDAALAELHRVVTPGGHLVFNMPNAFSVFRMLYAVVRRNSAYSQVVPRWAYWRWEIARALERSGWELLKTAYYGAERDVPGLPVFVPERMRRPLCEQAWAAPFILFVARRA